MFALGVVLLLIAGCDTVEGSAPNSAGQQSPSADPLTPETDASATPTEISAARRVDHPGGADHIVLQWTFVRLDDDGRKIVIKYARPSSCLSEVGVAVEEDERRVTVTPLAARAEDPCVLDRVPPVYRYVELASPLGDRELFHATVTS